MTAEAVPDLPSALAGLVGDWRGDGVAASIDGEGGDFRFGQQVVIAPSGPWTLSYTSRSWALDDEPRLDLAAGAVMTEAGFWRWNPVDATIELILASAAGHVSVCYGQIREDAAGDGAHLELVSDLIGRTATGEQVAAQRRLYSRRRDVLLYAVDQAAGDQPLRPRASAALHPV